jgi:hypothetical protein
VQRTVARADLDAGNLLKHPGEHAILGPWLRTIALDVPNGSAYISSRGALYVLRSDSMIAPEWWAATERERQTQHASLRRDS